MTTETLTRSAAIEALDSDKAITYAGARIVREGMEWCVTQPGGAFQSFPTQGLDRMTAAEVIDWLDALDNMAYPAPAVSD